MEKISKVVPGSVKNNIDMSKERPVRSGAPSYGAPIAYSTATLKKIEEAERAKALQAAEKRKPEMSPKELKHSQIVDKVTLNFRKTDPLMIQNENLDSTLDHEESTYNLANDEAIENMEFGSQIGPDRLSLYA
jgi:hypothetical protein